MKFKAPAALRWVLAGFLLSASVCFAQAQTTGAAATGGNESTENPPPERTQTPQQFISINFNDVDINVFIKFISELTGTNFVVDPRVKGKITIISPSRVSLNEAYQVFESVLEVHGFATVKAGKITKILPSPTARTQNVETKTSPGKEAASDKIVTQLISLTYADPVEIRRLFAPLIDKASIMLAYPQTNMLIITDTYSNIQRLMKILQEIDVKGIGKELSVIPLKYATASQLVTILTNIFQQGKRPPKSAAADDLAKFIADERTNALITLATEDDTAKIRQTILLLDKDMPKGKGKIHLYYLENSTAEDVAKVLRELSGKQAAPVVKGQAPVQAPFVSDSVQITADKATNSLIIMADKDDYLTLESIIKQLDIPRAMVYIESLIMEVNVNKDFNLGTEWMALGSTTIEGRPTAFGGAFGGTGFSNTTNLLGGATAATSGLGAPKFPSGVSLGVFSDLIRIGNLTFPGISAIINAYKKDQDVHILSTPQILTTDNEEAKITVGQNVPFQTRAGAADPASLASQVYSSYEYKDVGKTLKITPNINKDRMVRLKISLEVTALDSTATQGTERPTTFKRTIDTTVIVRDKNTVVIGGLIDDQLSQAEYGIPCLGDIPGLGWLFKTVNRAGAKSNLYVFITPHVIENPMEATTIYQDKKDAIDTLKGGKIKLYERENK
ncbi:MAG: type II secretion system secretin GspD [Desulfobacterales bacterium]|nr:type II secretion system secretin GspD [Desulfobacterales bacterium]